jgi:hypothetical protein
MIRVFVAHYAGNLAYVHDPFVEQLLRQPHAPFVGVAEYGGVVLFAETLFEFKILLRPNIRAIAGSEAGFRKCSSRYSRTCWVGTGAKRMSIFRKSSRFHFRFIQWQW